MGEAITDTSSTTAKQKQSDKADGKTGAGKPDELVSAFVTAIREPLPDDPIAALVAPAFSLGWYLRALTRREDATVIFAVGSGLTDLTAAQGIAFCRHR